MRIGWPEGTDWTGLKDVWVVGACCGPTTIEVAGDTILGAIKLLSITGLIIDGLKV